MDQIVPTFNFYGQHIRKDIWKKVRVFLPGAADGVLTVNPASFEVVRQAIIGKHRNRHCLTMVYLQHLGANVTDPMFQTFSQTHGNNMMQDI